MRCAQLVRSLFLGMGITLTLLAGASEGTALAQEVFQPYGPVWVRPGGPMGEPLMGGHERGAPLPLCRAQYRGGIHPGKVVGSGCNIGWGGKEVVLQDFEIATQVRHAAWMRAEGGQVPAGAFPYGEERGRPLYVCRAPYAGGMHPGKLVGTSCNFGYGGLEVQSPNYEVLVIPQWIRNPGALPPGALHAGGEPGRALFVCSARHNGGFHPGKLVDGKCNIGWGGQEVVLGDYFILVGVYKAHWVPAGGGVMDPKALAGGREHGQPLYLCRAPYQGIQPGKVVAGRCNFGYAGKEVVADQFEVLHAN